MSGGLKTFGLVSGILAFLICIAGGIVILAKTNSDSFPTGVAIYFIGKAVFVGSMLIIMTLQAK